MIVRRSPQCKAFRRALVYESLCPRYTPYVGAVVTNDWCITDKIFTESNVCSNFEACYVQS